MIHFLNHLDHTLRHNHLHMFTSSPSRHFRQVIVTTHLHTQTTLLFKTYILIKLRHKGIFTLLELVTSPPSTIYMPNSLLRPLHLASQSPQSRDPKRTFEKEEQHGPKMTYSYTGIAENSSNGKKNCANGFKWFCRKQKLDARMMQRELMLTLCDHA